jgi:polysaccharide biosynthesis protein PslG
VSDFAAVTSHLARRYRSSLAALEIWNEPNYNSGGYTTLNTTDRPRVYTAMVKAAFRAIKAAAPEIPVLAGATSFADTDFLRKLYSHGIKGHYDGISVHPYNEWRAPGAPHDPRWAKYDLVLGMQAVRRLMSAYGDSSPVWITELGWTTCRVGSGRWCITEAQQADYLARAVPIVRSWPWVRSLVVYNLRDKGTDPTDGEHGFGLVRRDYSPKPALAAVARAFAAVPAPRGVATTSTTLRRTSLADLRATSRRH